MLIKISDYNIDYFKVDSTSAIQIHLNLLNWAKEFIINSIMAVTKSHHL